MQFHLHARLLFSRTNPWRPSHDGVIIASGVEGMPLPMSKTESWWHTVANNQPTLTDRPNEANFLARCVRLTRDWLPNELLCYCDEDTPLLPWMRVLCFAVHVPFNPPHPSDSVKACFITSDMKFLPFACFVCAQRFGFRLASLSPVRTGYCRETGKCKKVKLSRCLTKW
jgi:hypothetical protein